MTKSKMNDRLGGMLTGIGGTLGVLGVIAMMIGFKLTLTPQMQDVLFYKGLFAASAILIVTGAIVGRRRRQEQEREELESHRMELHAKGLGEMPAPARDRLPEVRN